MVRMWGGIGGGIDLRSGTNWGSPFPLSVTSTRAVVSVSDTNSVPVGGTGEVEGHSVVHIWGEVTGICSGIGWKVKSVLLVCTLSAVDSVSDTISVALGRTDEIDLGTQFNSCGGDRTDPPDRSVLSPNPEFGTVCRWGRVTGGNGLCSGNAWVSALLLSAPLVGTVDSVFDTNSVLAGDVAAAYGQQRLKVTSFLLVCTLSAVDSVFDTISVALGCADEFDLHIQLNSFGEDRTDPPDRSVLSPDPEFRTVCRRGGVTGGNGLCSGNAWVSPLLLSVPLVGIVVSVFDTNSVLAGGAAAVYGHSRIKVKSFLLVCALSAVDSVFDTISVALGHADELDVVWVYGMLSWLHSSGESMMPLQTLSGGVHELVYLVDKTVKISIVVYGFWTGGCITSLASLALTRFGVNYGGCGVFGSTLLGHIRNNGK